MNPLARHVLTAAAGAGLLLGSVSFSSPPQAGAAGPATRPAAADGAAPALAADANPVDHYLIKKLDEIGNCPANRATAVQYVRRLMLDLTGQPPTPAQVEVFLANPSAEGRQQFINRVIATGAAPDLQPATQPAGVAAVAERVELQRAQAIQQHAQANLSLAKLHDDYAIALSAAAAEKRVKAAYLGVGVGVPNDTVRAQLKLPDGTGLVINYVDPDGPAKEMIRPHDVLQRLDDQVLVNAAQLVTLVRMHKPGEAVQVTVIREARPVTLTVKLVEKDLPPLQAIISQQSGDTAGDANAASGGQLALARSLDFNTNVSTELQGVVRHTGPAQGAAFTSDGQLVVFGSINAENGLILNTKPNTFAWDQSVRLTPATQPATQPSATPPATRPAGAN